MQIVTSPPKKKYVYVLIFYRFYRLYLVNAATAELWLAFWWWYSSKHWPESARTD